MIELLPMATYQTGVTATAEIEVPDRVRKYELKLARCTDATPDVWSEPDQIIRVQVEVFISGNWYEVDPAGGPRIRQSFNDWMPWGSFDAYGGKQVNRTGEVAEYSYLRSGLTPPTKGKKLRAFLLTASPVKTKLTLEWI